MKNGLSTAWRDCRLNELFSIKHGFAFDGAFFAPEGEYVLLTPGNFNDEGGFKLKDKEKYFVGEVPDSYILKRGDLIVAMTEQAEGLLGSSAVIPASNKFLHNQRLGLITDWKSDEIDIAFLYFLFNTRHVRGQIRASASGTKVRHTSPTRIGEVTVRIPPVETQRKIASILSTYDDLIDNNTRRIAILEAMAHAIYRKWFVEFRFPGHEKVKLVDSPVGKIPEGWRRQLGDVVTLKRGYDLPQSQRRAGDVPLVSSSGITDFHDESMVEGPGVVTGRYGTLGEVFFIPRSFWPLNTTLYVRDFHGNEPLLIVHLLRSLNLASQNAAGAVPGVNRNALHMLDVVFPPIELQKRIAPTFNAIERCSAMLRSKNANLRKTRDLLLPKLVSGQVDVENLDLETAESTMA